MAFSVVNQSALRTASMPAAQKDSGLNSRMSLYPNPFAETATVEFALPQKQSYTLQVVDVNGRVVARVAAGVAEAGKKYRYEVTGNLPDGLYVVRLTTDKATQTQRLLKIKQ
ncbi:T9SS type A sorting domain-containing protein [Hymenobacter sp. HDW8]|uniref:T9SS type A sorting domain-containing protein n=1 Tax=Hymenobacter sp. HDW8 TaxID=2714932 RepID=UPI00140D918F|nr:T9SS type A sorting domain-containing protein [Hymenobacter sp. HDW8]QIL75319.1 T9SS type A sorting domain-containing protein [Hymenobacter sp. HDW8]